MANVITITVWTIAIRIIGFFQLQTGHSSVRPEGFLLKVAGNILTTHGSCMYVAYRGTHISTEITDALILQFPCCLL